MPIKAIGTASKELKTRVSPIDTLMGVKIKPVRHNGAEECVKIDIEAKCEDNGIMSETTAPYTEPQNGKSERINSTLMERVRAALLNDKAEGELWAECLASIVHVVSQSLKAGLEMAPLQLLTRRRCKGSGFQVWGIRAWELKPKAQQRTLERRIDVGCCVGHTIGG